MTQASIDPNAELHAAQTAVQQQQHAVAIPHLANLLPQFCIHPLVTSLLDQLVDTAPDPLQLIPSGPTDFGTAAIHTYALGRVGDAGNAYSVLRQLAQAGAASGIIDWALPWLEAGQLTDNQRDEAVSLYFVSAHYRFSNRKNLPPDAVAVVKRWLPHIRPVMAARPYGDMLYTAYIIALRQAGEMQDAVQVCLERHRSEGSYHSAVSLATTYREVRQFDEWFASSQEALRIAPDDVPIRLDLGDCFWEEQGNLAEAEKWYADALRIEPEQAWAKPSFLAVRYLRTNEPRWRDELEDLADAQPQDQRVQVCLGRVTPFFAEFVHPADASVNNMNDIADQVDQARDGKKEPITGQIKLTTSGLDVPSCRRSIGRQAELWGGGVTVELDIRGMQSPDPREPRVPVRYRLWTYDGTTPQPAVAPPAPEVVGVVTQLAGVQYDLGVWIGYAAQIGDQLGEQGIPHLLGVMAYPPDPPDGFRTWEWTARMQFAAAFILAGTGASALDVLTDLVNGPLDWPTAACVVALTAVARNRPDLAPRVRQLFAELYRDLPRPGADYYENAILNCHLRLPGLPPEERAAVRAQRAEFEQRTRERFSAAEAAARLFLARPVPPEAADFDMGRIVIEAFTHPGGRNHPGFATTLGMVIPVAELIAEKDEANKAYFEEQVRVLRLIQAETKPEPAS